MDTHQRWCAPDCTAHPHTTARITVLGGKTSLTGRILLPNDAAPIVEISAGYLALDRGIAYARPEQLAEWWIRLAELGRQIGV